MAVAIPWQNSPDFQFEVALERFVYLFRIRWNYIAESWALDIFTRAKTPVSLGLRLVHSQDIFQGLVSQFSPGGGLFVLGDEPTYESMISGSSQLVYLTLEEILAL